MKSLVTSLAALALAANFALAEDAKPDATKEKPKRNAEDVFKKLDANSDSSVSLDEFKAARKDAAKAEEMFKKRDKDGDGKLSLEEFKAHAPKKDK